MKIRDIFDIIEIVEKNYQECPYRNTSCYGIYSDLKCSECITKMFFKKGVEEINNSQDFKQLFEKCLFE